MSKVDMRRLTVPSNRDWVLEPDGSAMTTKPMIDPNKGLYYGPMFEGTGVIGEKGQMYVVIGDPYDHRHHSVHRVVDLLLEAMKLPMDTPVRFRDGNSLNVKRRNLLIGEQEPEPVAEPEPPKAEPEPDDTQDGLPSTHPFKQMVECPHCGKQMRKIALGRHVRDKHAAELAAIG